MKYSPRNLSGVWSIKRKVKETELSKFLVERVKRDPHRTGVRVERREDD